MKLHRLFKDTFNNNYSPVLFGHGLGLQSVNWLLNSDENLLKRNETSKSLPFALAKEGYDIWLINFRGSLPSHKHINFSSKESKFWDFSPDDIIDFGFPASIDYVLEETRSPQLYYI